MVGFLQESQDKMGVKLCIAHEDDEVLNTDYFVEQLKQKWVDVKIHFITEPSSYILQFQASDDFWILGDFGGLCVWYKSYNEVTDAQFALWYRSIVPADWKLRMYDSGLYFDFISITPATTEEEIIAGFEIPFDVDKYI